jgi:hypothetical protein
MSSELHLYLGIYFKCKSQYTIGQHSNKECINCHKVYYALEKFCKECGGEIKRITRDEKIINNFLDEIISELEEEITLFDFNKEYKDDYIYYLLNYDYPDYKFNIDRYDTVIHDLTDINTKEIIQTFKFEHKNIINFLDKYYGKENYEVKFGYLQYYY